MYKLIFSFVLALIHSPYPHSLRTQQCREMEQFHRTDWMWDIHLSHKETNVCFRLSPTQAKCLNPIALPSERWISVPLRQLIPSGFLSQGFSRSPWMALKHSLSIGQTQPFSFMGSDNNCFPPSSGDYRERRKLVPRGGPSSRSPALFHSVSQQALHYLWQDSPGNQSWGHIHLQHV